MNAIHLYLRLQTRIILRSFKDAGFIVSLIVLLLFSLFLECLYKVGNQYIVIAACLLVLVLRHQYRKDENFLRILFTVGKMRLILMTEYSMISIPFILISLLKHELWQLIPIVAISFILPNVRPLRISRNSPIPVSFFYKGGIDLIYTLRITWWIFPLLLIAAVEGCINNNINLIKVCMIAATVILSLFGHDPRALMIQFGSFKLFIKENMKMVLQDASLFLLPFMCILLYKEEEVLSAVNMFLAGLFTVMSFLLLRYVTANPFILLLNLIILATAYLTAIMLWWGYLVFVAVIAIYLFQIYDKYNFLWR